jgi:hypothetical protein
MSTQVALDIVACSTAKLTASLALSNQIQEYLFINADSTRSLPIRAKATSGGAALTTYELAPDESVVAYCYTGGSNKLYFPTGSSHCPAGCDAVTPNNRAGTAFSTVKFPTATQMVTVGYLTNTALTGNVPWGTNAHTTLGHLTAAQTSGNVVAYQGTTMGMDAGEYTRLGYLTSDTDLTGNVAWGTNAHVTLGHLTAAQTTGDVVAYQGTTIGMDAGEYTRLGYLTSDTDLTGNVAWGTNAHTTLGRLTAAQISGDATYGGTALGFTTAQHGYLVELAAADPATNAVTYVTLLDPTIAGTTLAATCTGTVKGICDGR